MFKADTHNKPPPVRWQMMSLCGEEMSWISRSNRPVTMWTPSVNTPTPHTHRTVTKIWCQKFSAGSLTRSSHYPTVICILLCGERTLYPPCFWVKLSGAMWEWLNLAGEVNMRRRWWESESRRRFTKEGKKDGQRERKNETNSGEGQRSHLASVSVLERNGWTNRRAHTHTNTLIHTCFCYSSGIDVLKIFWHTHTLTFGQILKI